MNIPMRCRCGNLQGQVDASHTYSRAVCYCRDCQAFARFLGPASEVLDPQGGTDIIATAPASVRFTAGTEQLACMSLSERGMLRWYAACCRTPVGNTPRDCKTAYVGLVSTCLPCTADELDHAFGPRLITLNTASARGTVRSTSMLGMVAFILRVIGKVLGARLSGRYRDNPFFHAESGAPIRQAQALSAAQRQALDGAA